ncbi:type II secretion system protein GspM [Wenzhouxiangella limi]|uniref:Type II secretion system protein M n=1 Tax=Wenzhouxiangella limi TaxID=2707351 RepID=A0A845UYG6_9GAMM|nr:type II secretion system protein M [Wenzhouxiangella limi]NDY96457.1 type II secretion system protein M [Wenzhouxiangella limi]
MRESWDRLNARQRGLILLAVATLVAALLFVGLWEPLAEAREQRRDRVAAQQALLSWLDAVAPMAAELRRRADRGREESPRSLLGLADETARAAGLAGSLSRIEPAGDDRVRVWLDGAEFLATMQWLEQLAAGHPVVVDQLDLERGSGAGQVNVRATLAADG